MKIKMIQRIREVQFKMLEKTKWFKFNGEIHLKVGANESFKIMGETFHSQMWVVSGEGYKYNLDAMVETNIEAEEIRFGIY